MEQYFATDDFDDFRSRAMVEYEVCTDANYLHHLL